MLFYEFINIHSLTYNIRFFILLCLCILTFGDFLYIFKKYDIYCHDLFNFAAPLFNYEFM